MYTRPAAIQNILLAAYSVGLGTCWVGAFRKEESRETLKIPHGIRPVAIVPVGHPVNLLHRGASDWRRRWFTLRPFGEDEDKLLGEPDIRMLCLFSGKT